MAAFAADECEVFFAKHALTDAELDGSHPVSVSDLYFLLPHNCGRENHIGADRPIAQTSCILMRRLGGREPSKFRVIGGCPLRCAFRTKSGQSVRSKNLHMNRHALVLMFAALLQRTASALVREAEYQCNSPHQNEADGPRRI
jgi:hypothetical protein